MTETRQDVFQLDQNLYRLVQTDSNGTFVDSYVIVGEESALVIDLQRAKGSLLETIRTLTNKPLTVVITHAHYDHLGVNTAEFVRENIPIWMFREEYDLVREQVDAACECDAETTLHFLREGQQFDVGGYVLEASGLTGHTPRGCMLLERSKGWLFSGDALGNKSFYMQVPTATGLPALQEDLNRYLPVLRSVENLRIFTGHGIAESWYGIDWAEGIAALTGEIIAGRKRGAAEEGRWGSYFKLETELFPDGYLYRI